MLVSPKDGKCRECNGQLEIVEADDAMMFVECLKCGDCYTVETDAFGGGYWPEVMAEQEYEDG